MISQRISFSIAIVLLFASSAFAFCPSYLRNQTACSCEEYVDGAIIKCNGPKGPLVVENLKKLNIEVRELVLENANIIEIGPRAFVGMRIKKLVLDNNKIKLIQKNAFRGLESVLQELSIQSNRLTEVPTAALNGLRSLNILNLRCNRIGNITDVAFLNMPSLIEVHLGCNKICDISENAFQEVKQSVQNVILDNNCLEQMPTKALEDMNALIALHLKNNQIEKLGTAQLRNMTNLSLLSLTGNQIAKISPNFTANIPNLRYIYLAENQLEKIEPGAMKQFAAAEIIDLSHNSIGQIDAEMFNGMENLQHLNLEANAIKEVAPGAFATTPLLLLWLPHNCINAVTPNMFQGAPFLKQVSLANNNIRTVQPFSFAHLANLHTLDLSGNKIKSIQPSAIMGSDFLTVRVQENPLVCTQDGFHVMNGREAINLTTEANLICKTDYDNDKSEKCPQKPDPPVKKVCCDTSALKSMVTTNSPSTQTSSETTTVSEASSTQMSSTSVPKTSSSTTIMREESTPFEQSETTTSEPLGRARARQLNMERFYRLSRRPELLGTLKRNQNRPTKNGHKQGDLKDVSKDFANLPPHVAALVNGVNLPKARKSQEQQQEEVAQTKMPKNEEEEKENMKEEEVQREENGEKENESKKSVKQVSTTEIRKGAFPTAPYIDSMPEKMSKHRHEHLQPNGEFSRDSEPTHVQVEEKKPQEEVVAKQ